MGNSAKRDARAAARAKQQREALELRLTGMSHPAIAAKMKLSGKTQSWKLVNSAIEEIKREPAEAVLRLELERLDVMLLGLWTKAKAGDGQAVDRALRIMDRRAAYLGLDAPKAQQIEVATTGVGTLDPSNPAAVAQRLRQMFGERATATDSSSADGAPDAASSDPSVADGAGEVPERAPEE